MEADGSQGFHRLGGGDFLSDGMQVSLLLTSDGVSWTTVSAKKSVDLEWCDVIRCHRGKVSAKTPVDVQEQTDKEPCFTVHYIEKKKDHVWQHKYKIFNGRDNSFDGILSIMCEQCEKDKPRRLLVVINPVGGTGKGEAQYSRIVAPLFKLAQIETDVIVSQHPKHPEEIGQTYDFSKVDAVVTVGGDGTLQQVIHTWLPRLQREAGKDIEDPETKLTPLTCPMGIIPTGTSNGLAKNNYGCKDVATAALNIISGRKLKKNLMSVSVGGKHFGISIIIVGSGTWSDVLDYGLESRRFGWFRYPLVALKTIFKKRREFYVQLEYLPWVPPTVVSNATGYLRRFIPLTIDFRQPENEDWYIHGKLIFRHSRLVAKLIGTVVYSSIRNKEGEPEDKSTTDTTWVSIEGSYTGVNGLPGIFTPNEATGKMDIDGNNEGVTLLLEKQCGRMKYLSVMAKVVQFRKDMLDDDFITAKVVRAYRFRTVQRDGEQKTEKQLNLEKHMNVDGELRQFDNPEIAVRNHTCMMEMFGTGEMF